MAPVGLRGGFTFTGPLTQPEALTDRIIHHLYAIIQEGWIKNAVPQLRAISPRDSGRLANSIRVRRTSTGLRCDVDAYYWAFIAGLPRKQEELIVAITRQLIRRGFQHAIDRALRELGG